MHPGPILKGKIHDLAKFLLCAHVEQRILRLGKRARNARVALNLRYGHPVITAASLEQRLGVSAPAAQVPIEDRVCRGF